MLDISCELSAKQTIHIKCEAFFSKNKTEIRMPSATILNDALRVKLQSPNTVQEKPSTV